MKYYVYVLMNGYGIVEYVGYSKNLKQRIYDHTQRNPKWGLHNGKFYGRTDITMEVIKKFDTKKEARDYEGELKIQLGFEWTERTCGIKGGKIGGPKTKELYSKPILAYRKDTGKFVGQFPSQREAARQLGVHVENIRNVLSGKYKQTAGYTFKKENKQ